MLPDMTGYEVLAQFKKDSRFEKIPVVMLTGKDSPTDRSRGMKGGVDEYLTKPFDPARLLEVIVKYCEAPVQSEPVAVAEKQPPVVLRTPPEKKLSPSLPTPVIHEPAAKERGKNILVVEDSPTSRKVISMILTRKGYSVTEAVVGAEALQIVEEKTVDLVLLDVMLPDMSGFDILISLKKNQKLKKIPVVMLTGKKGAADREMGIRAGAVEYLTKPFDPGKLVSVIDEYA
jgi:CheY-like chemotaxis protein